VDAVDCSSKYCVRSSGGTVVEVVVKVVKELEVRSRMGRVASLLVTSIAVWKLLWTDD
jgi:hypothetical protein